MDDLIVSIPGAERAYIDAQVASGQFENPSDAICDLIRQARLREERERLETMIRAGINSEGAVKYTPEWLEAKKMASLAKARSAPRET